MQSIPSTLSLLSDPG